MNPQKLSIKWRDGRCVDIQLFDNPVAEYYYQCIKHLQHLDLHFNLRTNPLHPDRLSLQKRLQNLLVMASRCEVDVNEDRLLDQTYLNVLHDKYFDNTDGKGCDNPDWLNFHDAIHVVEQWYNHEPQGSIWVDFQQLAGHFVTHFDRHLLKYSTTNVTAGTCYIEARELGKTICKYIMDDEPFELEHMCKIMKPWIDLKPVLNIAVQDEDKQSMFTTVQSLYHQRLQTWLTDFQKTWTKHWNLENWDITNEHRVLPIGHIHDIETVVNCFKQQDYPVRITH